MALCRAPVGNPGLAAPVAVKGGHHLAHDLAAVAKDRIVAGVFRHQPDVALRPPKRLDHALFPQQSDHDVTVDRVACWRTTRQSPSKMFASTMESPATRTANTFP